MSLNFVSLLSLMVTSFNVYQFSRTSTKQLQDYCYINSTPFVQDYTPRKRACRYIFSSLYLLSWSSLCVCQSFYLFFYFFILFPLTSVNIKYNNIIPQPPNPQSPNNIMHFRLIFYLNISDTTYYLRKCMLLQYSGRGDIIYIYLAHNIYICTYKLYH